MKKLYLGTIIILYFLLYSYGCGDSESRKCEEWELTWDGTLPDKNDVSNMVLIEKGEFIRGTCNEKTTPPCNPGDKGYNSVYNNDETPIANVYVDDFYIDIYEVSNKDYQKCVKAGYCSPIIWDDCYFLCSDRCDFDLPNNPVVCVDWFQASKYCEFVGKRLPTETEWEKAARGTEGLIYPWGNNFDCHNGNFNDETKCDAYTISKQSCDGYIFTSPVDKFDKGKSVYNVYNMLGNVWEWVFDWYDPSSYSKEENSNKLGTRVVRGGSWGSREDKLYTANRYNRLPTLKYDDIGFRCAKSCDTCNKNDNL